MVASPSSEGASASARGEGGRVPAMQLTREGIHKDGEKFGKSSNCGKTLAEWGSGDGGGGGGWSVAVAWPMSVLQGFALAVIGMETNVVGAAVSVVDRAAAATERDSGKGFLGFEEVHIYVSLLTWLLSV